jgi:glycosyltransferase involved in cell wall biosynthesis
MKILLIGDYPPPYGGIAVQIQHLKATLPSQGMECQILNIGQNRETPSAEYEAVGGCIDFVVKLFRFARSGYLLHLFTNGENWKSWAATVAVGFVGRIATASSIVTITSGGTPAYLTSSPPGVRALAYLGMKLITAVVCRTDAIARAIGRWRAAEVLVLPAFSVSRLRPASRSPEAVMRFASKHGPLVASVVIFRREYDLPTLLQAFRDLRKEYPTAGLVVVGGGEEEGKVRELINLWQIEESVLLAGWVTHGDCLAIMREADVFVRTTLYDGDASSVREALALGIPVVATQTDFRPDGVVLVPPGNPDAIRHAIAEVLGRKDCGTTTSVSSTVSSDALLEALYHRLWSQTATGV